MQDKKVSKARRATLGLGLGLAAGQLLSWSPMAWAQAEFPSKPIRFVVPFAAGGALDFVARTVGENFTAATGQPVIVDNRPGASGIIALENIKRSPSDGYSVLITNMDSHVNNIGMFKALPYDPVKDFQPLGLLAAAAAVLVGNSTVPANSLNELVNYSRQPGANITFGTWGNGTYSHIAAASFARTTGIAVNLIPYKGESPVMQDILGTNVTLAMASVLVAKAYADRKTIKIYAVNGDKRQALMPDVPTFKELGYSDPVLLMRPWFGAYAPAGTPQPIVGKLNYLFRQALTDPVVAKKLSDQGFNPIGSSVAEHEKQLKNDMRTFTQVMRDIGIKPE
jgi:tripartite-type tricarboxylate transporter receptor subunit TctC